MPISRQAKGAQHKAVLSISATARSAVAKQVEKGEARLAQVVEQMTAHAEEVLARASQVGPKLTDALARHADTQLDLDDLEVASRVWERMLTQGRKVLRLDEQGANDTSVRVGIMVQLAPSRAQELELQGDSALAPAIELESVAPGATDANPLARNE